MSSILAWLQTAWQTWKEQELAVKAAAILIALLFVWLAILELTGQG